MTLDEIRARLAELRPQIKELGNVDGNLDARQKERWDELTSEYDALDDRRKDLEEREQRARNAAGVPFNTLPARAREHLGEMRGAAIGRVEAARHISDTVKDTVVELLEGDADPALSRWAWATSSDDYRTAFLKLARDPERGHLEFTPPEQRAWADAREVQRAMTVGSTTSGGFLLPTHLDPTIIATGAGSENPMRRIARVVKLTNGNVWNGVTSAGVTASWDPELTEVSDDTPTLANAQIPVFKGFAWVPVSFEAFEDLAELGSSVASMLIDAKNTMEGAAFATGNGTTAPTGIWTALDANTNVELTTTTAATIGEVDIHNTYKAVPARFRGRASWLTHPLWALTVKRLGTNLSSTYTGNLAEAPLVDILGRPVTIDDDAPSTATTTVADNLIVFGDFSNYVIVDRIGATIEFVPQVFGATNSRPIGARGWLLHWRVGADSVNDNAFRVLQDRTSA